MKPKFYITTAIPYASSKPHIGNCVDIILTDMIARYKRLSGFDVHFLSGSDEHGQKIEAAALSQNISNREYVDSVTRLMLGNIEMFGVSNDDFIRTTDEHHIKAVQGIFNKLYKQGDIYKGEYSGMYCAACEAFVPSGRIENGKCSDCGGEIIPTNEEAYFLRLSKYEDRLKEHFKQNPDFIIPQSRMNEMYNNFLEPGLQDLCVTRSTFKWGVPVEFDQNHVVYVWIDALSNYITALGYDTENPSDSFAKWWPCDLHVMGKDIVRFHSIYWPIILMALDIPLPKQILGHPWLLMGQDKMSKSKGNVLYADELCNRFGADAIRYYVLSELPFANDGNITVSSVISRCNTDLANTIGNLAKRTVSMIQKYFGGVIPEPGQTMDTDSDLREVVVSAVKNYFAKMDAYRSAEAIDEIMNAARRANKYIDETTPWTLAADHSLKPRLGTVMYNLAESIRIIGVMLQPIMPSKSAEILESIGAEDLSFESLSKFGAIKSGGSVGEAKTLFERIVE
ncbi:MAG: methionine--tRNA ligase [Oscillospiraceae bacterium]|nr:methionine--tRNA ligase [Oscillospiraceae bacterium]